VPTEKSVPVDASELAGDPQYASRPSCPFFLALLLTLRSCVRSRAFLQKQVVGDVRDRALVIVDDMLSTGGTVAASMNALLPAGCTPRAIAVVSHGLFVGRAEKAMRPLPIQYILTTDSVAERSSSLKVEGHSLGPLVAEAIRRLHNGLVPPQRP